MAQELIHTSARRGLRPGSSGYCTVAQTEGLREDLATALEMRSQFTHEAQDPQPILFTYGWVLSAGTTHRVLTRAVDAGLDFTGRRHFLAHHLVFRPSDSTGGYSPAEILLGWPGWRSSWSSAPRLLQAVPFQGSLSETSRIRLPAEGWKKATGDAGWVVSPLGLANPIRWESSQADSTNLLRLMAESLTLAEVLKEGGSWAIPFSCGGPSSPSSKNSLWVGRAPMVGTPRKSVTGSLLCPELLAGHFPTGNNDWIQLGRSGVPTPPTKKTLPRSPKLQNEAENQRGVYSKEAEARFSLKTGRIRKTLFSFGVVGLLLVFGGIVFWVKYSTDLVKANLGKEEIPSTTLGVPVPPPPSQDMKPPRVNELSLGEELRDLLWHDAGGGKEEKIWALHLFKGKSPSPIVIQEELKLIGEEETPTSFRLHEKKQNTAVSSTYTEGGEFSRGAARCFLGWAAWIQMPSGRERGLVFTTDLSANPLPSLSLGNSSPEALFKDLATKIMVDRRRWSLEIRLPTGKDDESAFLLIEADEDEFILETRLALQIEQREKIRRQALLRLTPFLSVNPEEWTEEEIQEFAEKGIQGSRSRGLKEFKGPDPWKEFCEIQREYRTYWFPLKLPDPNKTLLGRLLSVPGVEVKLCLDRLAVARIRP